MIRGFVATLQEQTEQWLASAHRQTALGRATLASRENSSVSDDPYARADAMGFLTDMVLALEDCVRVMAAAIDTLDARTK